MERVGKLEDGRILVAAEKDELDALEGFVGILANAANVAAKLNGVERRPKRAGKGPGRSKR